MTKRNYFWYITFLLLLILFILCSYLVTNNYFIPVILFLLIVTYYLVYGRKKYVKHINRMMRIEECYHFSYNLSVAINVKNSIQTSLESIVDTLSPNIKEYLSSTSHLDSLSQIGELRKYFKIHIFDVYFRMLELYVQQGGNIITMSSLILDEMETLNARCLSIRLKSKKSLINFITLWSLAILILVFTRFTIPSFYLKMLDNNIFPYLIMFFFIFVLMSIHMFLCRLTRDDQFGDSYA